jgi:hypothetical protein
MCPSILRSHADAEMETKESSVEVNETTSQRASALETSTTPQALKMEPGSEAAQMEEGSDTDVVYGFDGTNEENVEDIVGFSIGQEQLRMKSQSTPAYEKAQVLDQSKDYFDFEPEARDTNDDGAKTETPHDDKKGPKKSHYVLDGTASASSEHPSSPPSGSPDDISRSDTSRSILKDGFGPRTRRASSESIGMVGTLRKLLPGLPSMPLPKASGLPTFSFGSRSKDGNQLNRPKRSSTLFSKGNLPWPFLNQSSDPSGIARGTTGNPVQNGNSPTFAASDDHLDVKDAAKASAAPSEADGLSPWSMPKPGLLRRATSDHSLFIRNELERISTHDDAEKWASVSEQINSRFKAITDSFQDSAFNRMPKMPSVSLGSFRPGLQGTNSDIPILKKDRNDSSAQRDAAPNLPGIRNMIFNYSDKQPKHPHPILHQAVSALTGDVVVLGGYRGSILRSAKPPNKQLWVPVKVSDSLALLEPVID